MKIPEEAEQILVDIDIHSRKPGGPVREWRYRLPDGSLLPREGDLQFHTHDPSDDIPEPEREKE